MEVFSGYFMTVKPHLFCFNIYIFSYSENPNPGFSNAGGGYTFYLLSINRVGFCLSINRQKNRLFPSAFMRTNF